MKRSLFLISTAVAVVGVAIVVQSAVAVRSTVHNPAELTDDAKSAVSSIDSIEVEMQAVHRGLVVVRETSIKDESGGAVECQTVTTLVLEEKDGKWMVTNSRSRVDRKSCRLVG